MLEGNRGHQTLKPELEPQPRKTKKVPSPPRWLDKEAKKKWKQLARQLWQIGCLTEVDHDFLACFCQQYARWIQAEDQLKQEGLTITTTNGNIIQNPLVGAINKAQDQMRKFGVELGLSPSARSRIHVDKPEEDDLERILSRDVQ